MPLSRGSLTSFWSSQDSSEKGMEKKYDYRSCEAQARELWKNKQTYKFEASTEGEVFSIDTPPPTVSGSLHIGHLFSYTHTDIIARYKRLRGYRVFYPMGFDDNGLATERFVEKKNKIRGHTLKRSDFIKLCLDASHEAEKEFELLWRQLGLSIDWTKTYSTISNKARAVSQRSFIELYKKNLIYRREEPALFCTTCRTSVAQAELDTIAQSTQFNTIEFTGPQGNPLHIATTRPELLPACVAVFYHPDDARYTHLKNQQATTPFFEKNVPLLPDKEVDPEKGTGLVMCCTFGDQTDIQWFKTHKLPFVHIVGRDGKWTDQGGPLAGLRAVDARKKMLSLLEEKGKLVEQKTIEHNVAVHERCKREIEYLILTQWFVDILNHKKAFLERAEQINWTPAFMKARYIDWVSNLGWDWCISRQRFYGIPFPVWYCDDCSAVLTAPLESLPIDPQEIAYPGSACPSCSSTRISPETDVMDTWNTSSLTPQINLDWPQEREPLTLPMSMRPQAHDIIRTWAFYTIVKAHYHHDMIPWKEIVISGHVVAGKEKLSKSKGGGALAPEALLERYPADVLRYWTAHGKPGTDTAFSENQFKIGQRLLTKLWNAFRFCQSFLEQKPVKVSEHSSLNRWLHYHLDDTLAGYSRHFDKHDYHLALEKAERFFWHYFCDNYIELIKDQLFNPDAYSEEEIASTRATLHRTCFDILQMFAPVLPHITETLYQTFFKEIHGKISLHLTQLRSIDESKEFYADISVMEALVGAASQTRRLKSEHKLSLNTEVAHLILHHEDQSFIEKVLTQKRLLTGVTRAQNVEGSSETIEESTCTDKNGLLTFNIKL